MEKVGEALRIQRGGGKDQFEFRAAGKEIMQTSQQEIDIERTLVRLVHDDRVVAQQVPIALRLVEQHAVGHELHERVVARAVVEATGVDVTFVNADVGWECFVRDGAALPESTFEVVRSCDATLLGAITSKPQQEIDELGIRHAYRSPIVELRQRLDLFACLRPVRALGASGAEFDLLVVRENTEGLYAGLDIRPVPAALRSMLDECSGRSVLAHREDETALTVRVVTRHAVERIARTAFDQARLRRGRVTLAEKPNVMRASGGLFLEVTQEVARDYPDVTFNWENADAVCMRMVQEPQRYDVLLAGNLFGDLLSDLAAGMLSDPTHSDRSAGLGGLGALPSANLGTDNALFEPAHGSAPDIAGTGRANPVAATLAAAMLLDWAGHTDAAARVRGAVEQLASERTTLTPDWGGTATTQEVGRALTSLVSATKESVQ